MLKSASTTQMAVVVNFNQLGLVGVKVVAKRALVAKALPKTTNFLAKLRRLQISLQPSFFHILFGINPYLQALRPVKKFKNEFPYHYFNFNIKFSFVNRFLNFLLKKCRFSKKSIVFLKTAPFFAQKCAFRYICQPKSS